MYWKLRLYSQLVAWALILWASTAGAQQAFCGPTPCVTLGAATVNTLTFNSNSESINNGTDGTFDFTRNNVGVITITCSDDDANATCIYDSGGTGAVGIGSGSTTGVLISTDGSGDGELQLPSDSIGAGELDSESVCGTLLYSSVDPTELGATNDFMSFWDHGGSTTEANEDEFLANDALLTFHSLRCDVDVAPGVGVDAWSIVVRDDGAGTAVTCVIDESATSCTDGSNSAAVAAGSAVNLYVNSNVGGGADPANAALLTCTVCMGP